MKRNAAVGLFTKPSDFISLNPLYAKVETHGQARGTRVAPLISRGVIALDVRNWLDYR